MKGPKYQIEIDEDTWCALEQNKVGSERQSNRIQSNNKCRVGAKKHLRLFQTKTETRKSNIFSFSNLRHTNYMCVVGKRNNGK